MNMKILPLVMLFLIFSTSTAFADWGWGSLSEQKKKAINKLERRKKGFDAYLKEQDKREKKRWSDAFKQKVLRKEYAERKDKARKSFIRTTASFPQAAYKKFLVKRKAKRAYIERARREYSSVQKQLKEVFNDKRYKISGKKEFKL